MRYRKLVYSLFIQPYCFNIISQNWKKNYAELYDILFYQIGCYFIVIVRMQVSIINYLSALICIPKYLIYQDHLICTLQSLKSGK